MLPTGTSSGSAASPFAKRLQQRARKSTASVSASERRNWPCLDCGIVFTQRTSYDNHVGTMHEMPLSVGGVPASATRHCCLECGQLFSLLADLNEHRRNHDLDRLLTMVEEVVAKRALAQTDADETPANRPRKHSGGNRKEATATNKQGVSSTLKAKKKKLQTEAKSSCKTKLPKIVLHRVAQARAKNNDGVGRAEKARLSAVALKKLAKKAKSKIVTARLKSSAISNTSPTVKRPKDDSSRPVDVPKPAVPTSSPEVTASSVPPTAGHAAAGQATQCPICSQAFLTAWHMLEHAVKLHSAAIDRVSRKSYSAEAMVDEKIIDNSIPLQCQSCALHLPTPTQSMLHLLLSHRNVLNEPLSADLIAISVEVMFPKMGGQGNDTPFHITAKLRKKKT